MDIASDNLARYPANSTFKLTMKDLVDNHKVAEAKLKMIQIDPRDILKNYKEISKEPIQVSNWYYLVYDANYLAEKPAYSDD